MSPYKSYRVFLALIAPALLTLAQGSVVWAQAAASAPVYLEEPAPIPEPRVVREGDLSDKYDDGSIRVERHVLQLSDNKLVHHGKYTEYYRGGKKFCEGTYENGVYEGSWSFWHENGQLAKTVTFKKGNADGAWDTFRPDGTLLMKKGYKAGVREGTWIAYYEDGTTPKIEQTYANGALSGPRNTYFPSGKPRQLSNFSEGLIDGKMVEFDESGRKLAEANFEKGKLNGQLIRWGADGTAFEQSFRDNTLIPRLSGDDQAVDAVAPPPASGAEFRPINSSQQ